MTYVWYSLESTGWVLKLLGGSISQNFVRENQYMLICICFWKVSPLKFQKKAIQFCPYDKG